MSIAHREIGMNFGIRLRFRLDSVDPGSPEPFTGQVMTPEEYNLRAKAEDKRPMAVLLLNKESGWQAGDAAMQLHVFGEYFLDDFWAAYNGNGVRPDGGAVATWQAFLASCQRGLSYVQSLCNKSSS